MIVEIFEKGSNFTNFINCYFGVQGITVNDEHYIIVMETRPNPVISAREYEMKVSY